MTTDVEIIDMTEIITGFYKSYYKQRLNEIKHEIKRLNEMKLPIEAVFEVKYSDIVAYQSLFKHMEEKIFAQPEWAISELREAAVEYLIAGGVRPDVTVHITSIYPKMLIRDIREPQLNMLISIEGIVKKISDVRPRMTVGYFRCGHGHEMSLTQKYGHLKRPEKCHTEGCTSRKIDLVDRKSIFVDNQRMRIQESPEGLRGGQQPQSIDVDLLKELCGQVTPGDRITLNGIVRTYPKIIKGGESSIFDIYLDGVDSGKSIYNADGSLKKREIQGPVADDAQYETWGVFVQDSLGPADRRYEIIPGFRYTRAEVDADSVKDPVTGGATTLNQSWDDWVGSLRAQIRPWTQENIHLFAGLSQGFRAPNLSDLTRLDIARSGEFETPVSDLDPEHYLTGEMGIKSAGHWGSAQLTAYWTEIDDMIVRAPTGNKIAIGSTVYDEVTKRNAGDGHIAGVEWYQALKLGQPWTWWLSASAMDGQIEDYPTSSSVREEEAISRLMPPSLSSGLRWQDAAERIWIEGFVQSAEKADRLSAADRKDTERIPPGGTPGYCVGGLRGGWRITRNWSTSLSLENITDEDYRIHGSGVNEPGRNLIAMAEYKF